MAIPLLALAGLGALGSAAVTPTAINAFNKLNTTSSPVDYSRIQIGDDYSPVNINPLDRYNNLTPREQELRNSMASMIKTFPQVIDHRNGETYSTLYGSNEMTPNERSTRMSAASLVDVPENTITTPEPQLVTQNGVDIIENPNKKVTIQNRATGSSGSTKKAPDKPQTENQISGFNALIPLLALGGLGYFMARR